MNVQSPYETTSADRGKHVTVTVTGTRSGYTKHSVTSAKAYVTAPFTHTHAPTITGTTRVYSTLHAHVAAWSPKYSHVTYQWRRDGKAIKGATHSAHKLTTSDHGHRISVTVTGKRSTYTTTSRTSSKSAKVAWPKGVSTPKITSQPKSVGVTIGKHATFTVKASGGNLHYKWQYSKDGGTHWKTYSGKTSSKLTVTASSSNSLEEYRAVVSNVRGSKTSRVVVLGVQATRSHPFHPGTAFIMDQWGAVVGASHKAGTYGGKVVEAAPAAACYEGSGSSDAAFDLSFEFVGNNGVVYDDLYYDDEPFDSIWGTSEVYSGGCVSFEAYALVPASAVSGGVWRITDDSNFNDVEQYVGR